MRAIERTRRDSVVWWRRCSAYLWMTPYPGPSVGMVRRLAVDAAGWVLSALAANCLAGSAELGSLTRERAGCAQFVEGHRGLALDL
jgi:hypothetical protein